MAFASLRDAFAGCPYTGDTRKQVISSKCKHQAGLKGEAQSGALPAVPFGACAGEEQNKSAGADCRILGRNLGAAWHCSLREVGQRPGIAQYDGLGVQPIF